MNEGQRIELTEDQLNSILRIRRARHRLIGENLFSDPAWDVLLKLLVAKLGKRELTLDDLSGFAPPSTLARWIGVLEERKLVRSTAGPIPSAYAQLEISDDCAAGMIQLLGGICVSDRGFKSN